MCVSFGIDCKLEWSSITVLVINTAFVTFYSFLENGQRGYPCGNPMAPPVHISWISLCRHMDRTFSLHNAYSLIWSLINKSMHYCANFTECYQFPKKRSKGYLSGTLMAPPVRISPMPVCRHMDRTCSLHTAYSLIWSVINRSMHYCADFAECYHFKKRSEGVP